MQDSVGRYRKEVKRNRRKEKRIKSTTYEYDIFLLAKLQRSLK